MHRFTLASVVLAAALSLPTLGFAQKTHLSSADDGVSLFTYGLRGFWTGAELGLAAGFLSTGTRYESGEWRNLVLGTGIGAVTGVGLGLALALVDTHEGGPSTGWYVLRDMGYASMLGALTGAAVGALFWVDYGRAKNVLTGLAVGTLLGAGVGIAFGFFDGASARRDLEADDRDRASLQLTVSAIPTAGSWPALGPGVVGRF